MAMSKGMKIGLGVMAVGITGTIVFMLIKKMKNKKEESSGIGSPPSSTPISTTTPVSTTPVSTTPVNTGSNPFTSRTEGNAFRGWINDTYPDYAAEIDLDRTGSYNNSYINKAWTKYGSLYQVKGTTTPLVSTTSTNVAAQGGTGQALTNALGTAFNVLTGTTGLQPPTGTFDAAANANALYLSMKGTFTDEDLFFNTSNNMSSSERISTKNYFDSNNVGKGYSLCQWIEGDFSGADEKRALGLYGLPTGAGYFSSNC